MSAVESGVNAGARRGVTRWRGGEEATLATSYLAFHEGVVKKASVY